MRRNLDPFGEHLDEAVLAALSDVQLLEPVVAMGGLDASVAENGSNFSVGQRQLLCLARAILRNNRILIMDEATANVDHATDTLIQQTLRRRFASATVLTIAHRVNTIIDAARIMVVDDGRCVEFASPATLLATRPDGVFAQLVKQSNLSAVF